MKWTRQLLGSKNQKGMALLLALFTMMFIFFLVIEITYTTNVEYAVNANSINRLRAYYAARAGLDLSLLRIKIYLQAKNQLGEQIPPAQAKILDMIWTFPFSWPPQTPLEMSMVDKEAIQGKVKDSLLKASYRTDIFDEGSRIDLNDLDSPSKTIRETTGKLILNIYESKMAQDDGWARAHSDFRPQELVNNIIDWIDKDTASKNGGSEKQYYAKLGEEGALLPPTRGFRTLNELRLVAGMKEELFQILKDQVTVYGIKAINPNYASAKVLESFDTSLTKEVVKEIVERRSDNAKGGPFIDAKDFWQFVAQSGGRVTPEKQQQIPLTFDAVYNFRIRSIGEASNQQREIEAIVFDIDRIAGNLAQQLIDERKNDPGVAGATGQTGAEQSGAAADPNKKKKTNSNVPLPKGPPRIVYFYER